jgi:hypothetical protein
MATLLFLLTFLALLVLAITLVIKALRRKPIKSTLKIIGYMFGGYVVLWLIFYLISGNVTTPLGTDVCFDDWCAAITQIEKGPDLKTKLPPPAADSMWVVLYVKMSNHARGIAQKPSEPRIHLIDDKGNYWAYSQKGQTAMEKVTGDLPDIGSRLALHQELATQLVFAIPADAKKVKVLIEEGPFITKLLLPQDEQVFDVP